MVPLTDCWVRSSKLDRSLVGRVLLGLGIFQEVAQRAGCAQTAAVGGSRPAGADARRGAAGQRAGADERLEDLKRAERFHLLLRARQMAARDVAGLVRQDTDQLIGPFRAQQQAGVDEDALAAGDESVERAVLNDEDLDRARGRAAPHARPA